MAKVNVSIVPENGGMILPENNPWMYREEIPAGCEIEVVVFPQNGHVFEAWRGDVPENYPCGIPLRFVVGTEDLNIQAVFTAVKKHPSPLKVFSDFDNGNAIVRYIDNNGRLIILEPKQINDCCNIWWHFKVEGIEPGETLTIDVYDSEIAGDCQPVYSYDGEHWYRFNSRHSPYIQKFECDHVEIARNIPYSWERSVACAKRYSSLHTEYCEDRVLCLSEKGREVHQLVITDKETEDLKKRIIWVQARSHAFESHSSWVSEGFIQWVCGDSVEARDFRKKYLIYVIPVIDVDNVYEGGAGKSQWFHGEPGDLNRDWGDDPLFNVTRAVISSLQKLSQTNHLAAFIDLHDPWFYQGPEFYINTMNLSCGEKFFHIFSESLRKNGSPNSWDHCGFVTGTSEQAKLQEIGYFGGKYHPSPIFRYDLVEPERYTSSTKWVQSSGLLQENKTINLTMEIPHYKDDSGNDITKEGLLMFGSCLAASIQTYYGEDMDGC